MDNEVDLTRHYQEGRRAAQIGRLRTANPYLETFGADLASESWLKGYSSVETSILSQKDRARIYFEGWSAAQVNLSPRTCPYLINDHAEEVELWILGYESAKQ